MIDIKGRVDQAIKHAQSVITARMNMNEIGEKEYCKARDEGNRAICATFGDLSNEDIKKFQNLLCTINLPKEEVEENDLYNESVRFVLIVLDEYIQSLGIELDSQVGSGMF